MATVVFTPVLERHVQCPPQAVDGGTVKAVLESVFVLNPALGGYIVDDQGQLRQHIQVFVDGELIKDRQGLSDTVRATSEILVMQALSGG